MSPNTLRRHTADAAAQSDEELFHVTILSNLARGYDKYAGIYSKENVPGHTFPNQFFLLRRSELSIGINKARGILERHGLPGDRLLVISTTAPEAELHPNERTGLGRFVDGNQIALKSVHLLNSEEELLPLRIEEAFAHSLSVLEPQLCSYDKLQPRSVSFLPIAKGCQAKCLFCFSAASVSAEQRNGSIPLARIRSVLAVGKERGAERVVITGGGEPTLLKRAKLLELVQESAKAIGKVVLITNGFILAKASEEDRAGWLREFSAAGLNVLAISRHHHDDVGNASIMKLITGSQHVAKTWAAHRQELGRLDLRFICVLQKGGIEDESSLCQYIDWATDLGVKQLCFKELYVSTSMESVYHNREANDFSFTHQVPISLITGFAAKHGWTKTSELPWGSPVFQGTWKGKPVQVAAYCEPTLFWERSNGIARSWNVMADGTCLASLEDRASEVLPCSE